MTKDNITTHIANRIKSVSEAIDPEEYHVSTDERKVRDALLCAMMARDMARELRDSAVLPEAVEACAKYIIEVLTV